MTAIRCLSKYALGTQLFVLSFCRNLTRKSEKHDKLHIYAFDIRLLVDCTESVWGKFFEKNLNMPSENLVKML